MINLRISKDTASNTLRSFLVKAKHLAPVYAAGASACAVALDDHLRKLQARGNKMGWPPRNFFHGGPDSVNKNIRITQLTDSGAVVAIDDYRFHHRITGGTVRPKNAGALAIPMTGIAYHVTSPLRQNWPGLKIAGGKLLAGGVPQYGLAQSVTHKPKPEEKPDGRVIGPKVLRAVRDAVAAQFGLAPGATPKSIAALTGSKAKASSRKGSTAKPEAAVKPSRDKYFAPSKAGTGAKDKYTIKPTAKRTVAQVKSRGIIRGTRFVKSQSWTVKTASGTGTGGGGGGGGGGKKKRKKKKSRL
jgi:hypothetical protein